MTWNLDVVYPYPFSSLLSLLSVFSFDFLSSACMFESSNLLSEVYLWSAVPLALSGCILFSYRIQSCLDGASFDNLRSRYTYYVLLMSYLTLPSVCLKQFQVCILSNFSTLNTFLRKHEYQSFLHVLKLWIVS